LLQKFFDLIAIIDPFFLPNSFCVDKHLLIKKKKTGAVMATLSVFQPVEVKSSIAILLPVTPGIFECVVFSMHW